MQRLLSMQSDSSFLVRAKAQSVFRACVEQMEMYKYTTVFQGTVRSFIESAMEPWMTALNGNLGVDIRTFSGDEFNAVIKLKYATYKVVLENAGLMVDYGVVGKSISICFATSFGSPSRYYYIKS